MNSKELISTIGKITGKSLRTISSEVGVSNQLLGQKINQGRLRFKDACRICDAVGLKLTLFNMRRHTKVDFDIDSFLKSNNDVKFDDAVELLGYAGIDVAVANSVSGTIITASRSGYGRRIRRWVGDVSYDTILCNALSSGLKSGAHKYGCSGKYDTDDARELYRDDAGRLFFAVYGESMNKDAIVPCTEEEAEAFIAQHGYIE